MSFKRARTPSPIFSESATPSPTPKASRVTSSTSSARLLLCTLPPTCNPPKNNPTPLSNTKDLESHYATYHAHVCEEKGCGCVFPDGRLLELHQTECHDPLAAVRKERGEKIFACHLSTCDRLFLAPKARRLHLIQAHGFPKEYFFAVTNKGVGGLLQKWGQGVSMVRGEWKPRDRMSEEGDGEEGEAMDEDFARDELGGVDANESAVRSEATSSHPTHPDRYAGSSTSSQDTVVFVPDKEEKDKLHSTETDIDGLADSMTSLSLIPSTIRFGRGGKAGGFGYRGRGGLVSPYPHQPTYPPRGRGAPRSRPTDLTNRGVHRPAVHLLAPARGVLPIRRGLGRAGYVNAGPGRGRSVHARGRG